MLSQYTHCLQTGMHSGGVAMATTGAYWQIYCLIPQCPLWNWEKKTVNYQGQFYDRPRLLFPPLLWPCPWCTGLLSNYPSLSWRIRCLQACTLTDWLGISSGKGASHSRREVHIWTTVCLSIVMLIYLCLLASFSFPSHLQGWKIKFQSHSVCVNADSLPVILQFPPAVQKHTRR